MKDKSASSTAGLTAFLSRLAIAFCLGFIFDIVCFVLLWRSESSLPQDVARLLTRIIW